MKHTFTAIILVSILALFSVSCKNETATEKQGTTEVDSMYSDLRNIALTTKATDLGLSVPKGKNIVYGVVMDIGADGGIATMTTFATGDASLYTSTGGGIIGGGQHENVNSTAKQFITVAQQYIDKATKTETTALPSGDEVRFYLLTNNGIYTGTATMESLENNTSPWFNFFKEANKVLTQLRLVSEKQ